MLTPSFSRLEPIPPVRHQGVHEEIVRLMENNFPSLVPNSCVGRYYIYRQYWPSSTTAGDRSDHDLHAHFMRMGSLGLTPHPVSSNSSGLKHKAAAVVCQRRC
uniref:Uncharacterized protein n=1 Tax=Schistocephalus solidus TaxID=70667 RepID=A0A0X3Q787_SCHSO